MKIKIQITISSDEGAVEVVEAVVQLERGELCPEELGLNLAEAKVILSGIQRTMVGQTHHNF